MVFKRFFILRACNAFNSRVFSIFFTQNLHLAITSRSLIETIRKSMFRSRCGTTIDEFTVPTRRFQNHWRRWKVIIAPLSLRFDPTEHFPCITGGHGMFTVEKNWREFTQQKDRLVAITHVGLIYCGKVFRERFRPIASHCAAGGLPGRQI